MHSSCAYRTDAAAVTRLPWRTAEQGPSDEAKVRGARACSRACACARARPARRSVGDPPPCARRRVASRRRACAQAGGSGGAGAAPAIDESEFAGLDMRASAEKLSEVARAAGATIPDDAASARVSCGTALAATKGDEGELRPAAALAELLKKFPARKAVLLSAAHPANGTICTLLQECVAPAARARLASPSPLALVWFCFALRVAWRCGVAVAVGSGLVLLCAARCVALYGVASRRVAWCCVALRCAALRGVALRCVCCGEMDRVAQSCPCLVG
jgi:hypothetical protein